MWPLLICAGAFCAIIGAALVEGQKHD